MMNTILDKQTFEGVKKRIGRLSEDTTPHWGKMTAAQMMAHAADVQEAYNGNGKFGKMGIVPRLFKGMIKKLVIGDRPYQKNMPTAPAFKQKGKKDFNKEKARLIESLGAFYEQRAPFTEELHHPLWGNLTMEERAKAVTKHLYHHLHQFGV